MTSCKRVEAMKQSENTAMLINNVVSVHSRKIIAVIVIATVATINGVIKSRRNCFHGNGRQGTACATPISSRVERAIGNMMLLKKGGPTVIFVPVNSSDKIG